MTTQAQHMNTQELNGALHAHYIKPEDRIATEGAGAVYLNEVTAPNSNRRADAVYMGLWSSRGAGRIEVCELKTSKADFRRELDQPAKAEAWWPYCNAFWIVAPSTSIAPPELLPEGWGLMVPGGRGRRFRVVVKPKEHEATLTLELLITLLKCTETVRVNSLRQQGEELRKQAWGREQELRRERGVYNAEDRLRLEHLADLEKALGMELNDYPWRDHQLSPEVAGEGLKAFMQGQAAVGRAREYAESAVRELEQVSRKAEEQAKRLREALGAK